MFKMIANGIEVDMFVGICDFEYKQKQKVVVNVVAWGKPKFKPENITECLDYSRICSLVHSWTNREHVDLVETLLQEVIAFCFEDNRIEIVDVEILKPEVIPGTNHVGVGAYITREEFTNQSF
jgi:dihydroneopterin aldolase